MAGNEDWRWRQAQALQATARQAGGVGAAQAPRPAAAPRAAALPAPVPTPSVTLVREPLFAAWLTPWVLGLATGLALAAMAVISWSLLDRADRPDPAVLAANATTATTPAQPAERATPPRPAPGITAAPAPPLVAAAPPPVAAPPVAAPPAPVMVPALQARRIPVAPDTPARPRATALRRPATGFAARPSFDCRRAVGEVNRMICADTSLAQLDRALAARYRRIVATMPGEEWRLDEAQADFLNARQRCTSAACVERVMRNRAADLERE